MRAVTTRARACLVAGAPATASMLFLPSRPWPLPYGFASDGSIVRDITVFDPATGVAPAGTARFCHPRLASPRDSPLSRRAPRGACGDAAAHRGRRSSPAASTERSGSSRGAGAAPPLAGAARRRGQRSRARCPRGRPGGQGRLVGSPSRGVRHHLPREGEPPDRSHGALASPVEPAPLGRRDPRRGLGRGLLRAGRGSSCGPELARLPPAARGTRGPARVLPAVGAHRGGGHGEVPRRERLTVREEITV